MASLLTDDLHMALPYSVIARGYDLIMSHVDYEYWAQYTDQLIWQFHPDPHRILELGCGTGTLATLLQPMGDYAYTATDLCPEMIAVARIKAEDAGLPIAFGVEDFSKFTVDTPQDVVILLYDGLNYLLHENDVLSLFHCSLNALHPGGIFFFDQSTPANSINNEAYFSDEGEMNGFAYIRDSEYDRNTRLHTTSFEIRIDGDTFFERHVQRAYSVQEIKALLEKAGFEIEVAFDGFTANSVADSSERVHWVVRRPA